MDLQIIILNKVSQTEKTNIWYHLYVEIWKKNDTNVFIYKTETGSQAQKT